MTGNRASEAFSILSDETRLSVLLALWEAFGPVAANNAVSFSDLRERLGCAIQASSIIISTS